MRFKQLIKEDNTRISILKDKLTKSSKRSDGANSPVISEEDFYEIIKNDPTTRLNGVDLRPGISDEELNKVKAGKYVMWLLKTYIKPPEDTKDIFEYKRLFIEDLYKTKEDLSKYDKFKHKIPEEKRDINKVESTSELYDLVKGFKTSMLLSKSERQSLEVHPGAEMIYDGDKWRVIKISDANELGKEAACFYGGNNQETRWCTSAPGGSAAIHYIQQGPLYVIYNPKDKNVLQSGLPAERYQVHLPTAQYMDSDDRPFKFLQRLSGGDMSELKDAFKPELLDYIKTKVGGTTLVVEFGNNATGAFCTLYGIDALFSMMKPTLKKIDFQNKDSSETVEISVPESLGKFVDVEQLTFVNCIKSLPDSICNLTKLKNLTISKNPKLTKVPECISNLTELMFYVRTDTPAPVPKGILSRMATFNDGGTYVNK